jgi:PadR family transcriptional regulator PadR
MNRFDSGAADSRELYSGLIRIHILHHACRGAIFGLEMIEELARHDYSLSPGTLYPLLHGLEKKGYLRSAGSRSGRRFRRMYKATAMGRRALIRARERVKELLGELLEGHGVVTKNRQTRKAVSRSR